jgi:thiol-disulfide isomerase/thioredoxin
MWSSRFLLGCLVLAGAGRALCFPPSEEVKLQDVTHEQFLKALAALKGKVVVVDFWGDFCIPCKEEFPHLVELHKKYARKGVVCVSVSVDTEKGKPGALKFLKAKGATFPNYWLKEPLTEVWQKHWDLNGPPAVFVFDAGGKQAGRFDHNDPDKGYSYADVEKLVQKVLESGK